MFNEKQQEILKTIGIRVTIKSDYPVVCETLERIGIINHKDKKVYPSCYCYQTTDTTPTGESVYVIAHFKELFVLQDKPSTFNDADSARLKTVAYFMDKWGVVSVINKEDINEIMQEKISVLPHKHKKEYAIVHKFRNSQ